MTRMCSAAALRSLFVEAFSKLGIEEDVYLPVVDGLIETSLRGVDSHGIRLFSHYVECVLSGRINKKPHFRFTENSATTALLDADDSFGITASKVAMEKAIELAKANGTGAVAVKNSTHFGAAAIFSLMAARQGMIAFSCTHTDSFVVPYGGKKPFLGTNALSFAAPCEGEEPFCLDMATSIMSFNKLRTHREKNEELEPGWAVDKDGNPCIDPHEAAYLNHFGSYKGYGVALMVEILCSMLTGMKFGPQLTPMFEELDKKRYLGHFFFVIDISRFEELSVFKKRMRELMDSLRSVPPAEGYDKVRVANDPQKEFYAVRSKDGIPLSDVDYEKFSDVARRLKLDKKFIENLEIKGKR
ncbi:Ldh family oxidoreductase [Candidatus Woesearchaeota archaeon]|nr:Ldh family oxidoreductase [Candidatus Woesearchaeota archaeon]